MTTESANAEALRRVLDAEPVLVDLQPAAEVIPNLDETTFLHAGPPLAGWHEACGALRGAVSGTLLHLGLAKDADEAEGIAAAGGVRLIPANDVDALGTYGAVIGARSRVFVVEDRMSGRRAFSAINEGRGKALRYGSTDAETLARFAWLEGEFAELLGAAIRRAGGIKLLDVLGQALHMGDEGHSRQKAASALFANLLAPHVAEAGFPPGATARMLGFLGGNEIFFLPLAMAAAKTAMAGAEGIAGSTMVTCMAFNGVRCGIRMASTGRQWFTAPVPDIKGRFFEGYGPEDAGPVIGDSEIAETMGLGAFAMTGAPALARYVGGTLEEANRLALAMYGITLTEHPRLRIPALDYRGTPLGIDARRVVSHGVEPVFSTGIAHRTPGIGQIGAGYGRVPPACFAAALEQLGQSSSEGPSES